MRRAEPKLENTQPHQPWRRVVFYTTAAVVLVMVGGGVPGLSRSKPSVSSFPRICGTCMGEPLALHRIAQLHVIRHGRLHALINMTCKKASA